MEKEDLMQYSDKTHKWYETNAVSYAAMSENISHELFVSREKFIDKVLRASYAYVSSILDLGCGGGRDMSYFHLRGVDQVFGVDYSSAMCDEAANNHKVTVQVGDVRTMSVIPNRHYGVWACGSLVHMSMSDLVTKVMPRIACTLKVGGIAYVSLKSKTHNDDSREFNLYDIPDFLAAMLNDPRLAMTDFSQSENGKSKWLEAYLVRLEG